MNEFDPIEQTVAKFREVVAPEAVRDANRKAVQSALEQRIATRWWQRSINVPLPVVLATAAALLISLYAHLFQARENGELPQSEATREPSVEGQNIEPTFVAASDSHTEYSETQRYLSGVGVIDRDIRYRIEE
jgi:hypothetical protein